MARLEKWYMVSLTDIFFVGKVYDDNYFANGTIINTKKFINIDPIKGLLYTEDKTYILGTPDSAWITTFYDKNGL